LFGGPRNRCAHGRRARPCAAEPQRGRRTPSTTSIAGEDTSLDSVGFSRCPRAKPSRAMLTSRVIAGHRRPRRRRQRRVRQVCRRDNSVADHTLLYERQRLREGLHASQPFAAPCRRASPPTVRITAISWPDGHFNCGHGLNGRGAPPWAALERENKGAFERSGAESTERSNTRLHRALGAVSSLWSSNPGRGQDQRWSAHRKNVISGDSIGAAIALLVRCEQDTETSRLARDGRGAGIGGRLASGRRGSRSRAENGAVGPRWRAPPGHRPDVRSPASTKAISRPATLLPPIRRALGADRFSPARSDEALPFEDATFDAVVQSVWLSSAISAKRSRSGAGAEANGLLSRAADAKRRRDRRADVKQAALAARSDLFDDAS